MTYEEVKAEVERYAFDPDTEVVVERSASMSFGTHAVVCIGLRVRRPCVDDPAAPRTWIYNTELHPLEELTPELVLSVLENRWVTVWHHELREWMTRDGVRLHDPHGTRKETTE